MADSYPYMISNNKISSVIENIKTAAKPARFTHELLTKMGFSSSNDRAIVPLFKKLGFLNEDGAPTAYYDDLRDATKQGHIIADRIKALYSDLYEINTEIHKKSDTEIKSAFSRITGKDESTVVRYFNTFKALVALANFDTNREPEKKPEKPATNTEKVKVTDVPSPQFHKQSQFHYNIQIHLPATTDISVYNAIFKSLKDNLILE